MLATLCALGMAAAALAGCGGGTSSKSTSKTATTTVTRTSATDVPPDAQALNAAAGRSVKVSVAVRAYKQGSRATASFASGVRVQKGEFVQVRATVAPGHRDLRSALQVTIDRGPRKVVRASAGGYRAPATGSATISGQGHDLQVTSVAYICYISPSWYCPATVARRTADSYELVLAPAPSSAVPVVLTLTLG